MRVAYSADLGELPVDPRVSAVIEAQLPHFTDLGCVVDAASPDFSDADEIFKVWRAVEFHAAYAPLLETQRDSDQRYRDLEH